MAAETKVDLYKLHKAEYAAPKKPTFIQSGKARYLAISGRGAPGGEVFQAKLGALYAMAYTIKMTRKFEGKGDYVICKLEGQYWPDEGVIQDLIHPDELNWKLLIRTPDFVGSRDLKDAVKKLVEKGKGEGVEGVEILSLPESKCVQMLHVGPYENESETLDQMRTFAGSEGFAVDGQHHEIYLSDPRRVAPEKLRTILRLPVVPATP